MKPKKPGRTVMRRTASKASGSAGAVKKPSSRRTTSQAAAVAATAVKPVKRKSTARAATLKPQTSIRKSKSVKQAVEPKTTKATSRPNILATKAGGLASAATKVRAARKVSRRPKLQIPPILLEGDRPPAPLVSGPGERYVLGPTPPLEKGASTEPQLPEAYGTKRLFLAARDPQWLYAHWDLTREQQRLCNQRSADGHLVLRVYLDRVAESPLIELHVHPESRHWFVHVGQGGAKYVAELGYYRRRRHTWTRVSVSAATLTPQEHLSEETEFEFATIPPEMPLPRLVALVRRAASAHAPLAEAIEELRAAGHPALPKMAEKPAATWTPEQERALAKIVNMDAVRRVWIGSLEITELIRRQHLQQLTMEAGALLGLPTSPRGAVTSISSPFGGEQPGEKGFWFNVNAELIVYGATEPDATVTIGGRQIKLRPEGSFSYRFALPDGNYDLPAVAVSADKTDGRAAELRFSRQTAYHGEVGKHPQDPALKPPTPESL